MLSKVFVTQLKRFVFVTLLCFLFFSMFVLYNRSILWGEDKIRGNGTMSALFSNHKGIRNHQSNYGEKYFLWKAALAL